MFDEIGRVIHFGQFKLKDQTNALTDLIPSHLKGVICEDYRNHGWTQQKRWSRNQTSKNIGKIELLCELRSVPIHLQPNTVKAIGYKWAGMDKAPANHSISHQYDAVAHGVYWLQCAGIREPGLAIKENQRGNDE